MKEFFVENWQFIVEVGLTLIVFLVAVFKKQVKVKVDETTLVDCFSSIPVWISEAEDEYGSGHGPEKLNYVLRVALNYICENEQISVNCLPGSLIYSIKAVIEDILSTPTKKGGNSSEKR